MPFKKCGTVRTDKIISVSENSREFKLENPAKQPIHQVQVDGCLIEKHKEKCDWLFEILPSKKSESPKQVFYIELKGKNIKHAFEQLAATIQFCKQRHQNCVSKKSYIVTSRVSPRAKQTITLWRKKLADNYKTTVEIKNNQLTVAV